MVRRILCALLLGAGWCAQSFAQAYPAKPVRLVVPTSPGGATDVMARALAQKLSDSLAQRVFVENRPGAHGMIGAELVAKSPPDGYTLLFTTASAIVINPFLYSKLPYDSVRDFAPVAMCCAMTQAVIVNASLGVQSLQELIALARSKPGALSYGSMGSGSSGHLHMEALKRLTGMELLHVPYKGSAPAVTDLVTGQISMMVVTPSVVESQVRSGRLKALAVGSRERSPLLPDVPTAVEAGVPGFETEDWLGLFAPAAMPKGTVGKLNAVIMAILDTAEFRKTLRKYGQEPPLVRTPEEFAAFIGSDMERSRRLVQLTGAKAD
jgi:tripartite-type tricarboxylate transporter receptor subunit TctC